MECAKAVVLLHAPKNANNVLVEFVLSAAPLTFCTLTRILVKLLASLRAQQDFTLTSLSAKSAIRLVRPAATLLIIAPRAQQDCINTARAV